MFKFNKQQKYNSLSNKQGFLKYFIKIVIQNVSNLQHIV